MKLNPKQAAFVREYLVDLNATQAATRAGYSKRTAKAQGHRLLTHADVRAAVDAGMKARGDKLDISAERVLLELARICLADISKAYDEQGRALLFHEMPEDVRRAISSVDVEELFDFEDGKKTRLGWTKKLRFWDKTRAAELIFKHLGANPPEKLEVTGKNGAPLNAPTPLSGLSTDDLAALEATLVAARKAR